MCVLVLALALILLVFPVSLLFLFVMTIVVLANHKLLSFTSPCISPNSLASTARMEMDSTCYIRLSIAACFLAASLMKFITRSYLSQSM
jgi:hypothetical protein